MSDDQPLSKFANRIIETGVRPASSFLANPKNWRKHPQSQRDALNQVLTGIGWVTGVIESSRSGFLIDGHERIWQALEAGEDEPVPYTLVDLSEEEEAAILASFDSIGAMAETDAEQLRGLLTQVQDWNPDFSSLTAAISDQMGVSLVEPPPKPTGKPNPRNLPIDVYITCGSIGKSALEEPSVTNSLCCLAVRMGLKYGIQSTGSGGVCPLHGTIKGHEVGFIDNDYFHYDHEKHSAAVALWSPKYATVRDIMTKEQCSKDKIKFYELPRILDWAEELSELCENVIVIPKYDCLDKIPEKFVLGYSVPTSHGGTPLPAEMFKGRRVHLLGGSWNAQLAHMNVLGDDVVSLDNNYIIMMSKYGQYLKRDGTSGEVAEIDPSFISPRWIALSISLSVIATDVYELYTPGGKPQEDAGEPDGVSRN